MTSQISQDQPDHASSSPMTKKVTRRSWVGPIPIGGGAPVVVQTMANTDTRDVAATLAQINSVAERGAELVRVAVPDEKAGRALFEIIPQAPIPVVADIHFDWRLAMLALEAGAPGLRLNPGNLSDPDKIKKISHKAGQQGAAIRVGVNSGSLDPRMAQLYGHGPEAMAQSALKELSLLEDLGFHNLVVSLKASDVRLTVAAVRLLAERTDCPQHLGITEAGDLETGVIKSAVGLGVLLHEGLGDTIRVSLTGPPEAEVDCAWEILRSLGLRSRGPEFISCPTCGRCEIDLVGLLKEVKNRLRGLKAPLKIAVMGCVVNGPGEGKRADLGVAGGRGRGILFERGQLVGQFPYESLAQILEDKARAMAGEAKT
ncbi:MAG: flavodoxin-dependent (E)-4-hydroxy-3-methylbut-2-enyl-diphosphate synthase [Deltaproteobacteria bacterium]|jgi:(E)-4-hydroxy-3-methylbut-2-enyl-diphosphate synthase|nr:flavodoxin-dependent (E)-4-hydroxy-3-methylbut-2-enyl-diphosphate synthase [Deltaproteobacteria bacterium]